MNIRQLFNQIEHLQQLKPFWEQFEFGLENDNIKSIFKEKGLNPTDDLIELYSWHNGSISTKKIIHNKEVNSYKSIACFIPQIAFFALEDCFIVYESQLGVKYPINLERSRFFTLSPNLFPILNGDYYINLEKSSDSYGMIHTFDYVEENIFPTVYDSLESIFKIFIECMEKNIFYFDSDNLLSIDYDKNGNVYDEILKKYNPKSYGL
jgi:hypothetical protein